MKRQSLSQGLRMMVLFVFIAAALSGNISRCFAMTPEQYIESIASHAARVKHHGLFPSVAIAQSCRETGFGKHLDAADVHGRSVREYHNVLGKKWHYGHYYEKMTTEGYGESQVRVVRKFQVYHSLKECFDDYAKNILTNPAYRDRDTSSAEAFIRSIAHRYATDNPNAYAEGVLRIIAKYDLTKYD